MKLTPSKGRNHNLPSADLVTLGPKLPARALLLTPSELSKTVVWIVRFGLVIQASNSECAIRTSPHGVYSHAVWSSSSSAQSTASHGNPFLAVIVLMLPFFKRLSPPSVATQRVPSRSRFRLLRTPAPKPLEA